MDRRNLFRAVMAAGAGALALARPGSTARAAESSGPKVVYHLSDLDKVNFVLGNIQNHLDGMGGPDKVTIALVVHGPALKAFQTEGVDAGVSKRVAQYSSAGVQLHACGNTMRAMKITLKDLLSGFVAADAGGVVRLVELQQKGYFYLRP